MQALFFSVADDARVPRCWLVSLVVWTMFIAPAVASDTVDTSNEQAVPDVFATQGNQDTAAQFQQTPPELTEAQRAEKLLRDSLVALQSLVDLRDRLQGDITEVTGELSAAETDVARADFTAQIESLKTDLDSTQASISEIATGADLASLGQVEQQSFDFQQELFSLLEPLMKELKGLTSHVRAKSTQRDKISYYEERIPVVEDALLNLKGLISESPKGVLRTNLREIRSEWQDQLTFMSNQLNSAKLQLEKLESSEVSLTEASQSYFKTFVRTRGLYLGQALLAIIGVLLLGRLIYRGLERFVPGYRVQLRSFRIRLFDLLFRIGVVLCAILGPMVVFYIAEDWVLFSIGLLLLLGVALTLRTAIPRFWSQIQLFLNIGSVREGERLEIDALPWRVKQINFYSTLENPTADLELRVKIDELADIYNRLRRSIQRWCVDAAAAHNWEIPFPQLTVHRAG